MSGTLISVAIIAIVCVLAYLYHGRVEAEAERVAAKVRADADQAAADAEAEAEKVAAEAKAVVEAK